MSKYIIDIPKTVGMLEKVGCVRYTYFDGIQVKTIVLKSDEIEELNSDYINEHFGELQETAYQKGLDDAWECAKKMTWTAKYGGYGERLSDVFGRTDSFDFYDYTPNEAIEKLKAFEQKQDEINVGDEVDWEGVKFVVTRIFRPYRQKEQCDGVDMDGCVYADVIMSDLTKTGRHFTIDYLEEMKE